MLTRVVRDYGSGLFFFLCSFYPTLFTWRTLGMFPAAKAAGGYFPFLSASGVVVPYDPWRGNAWVKAWDISGPEAAYRWGSCDPRVGFSFIFCCGGPLASYTSQG